MSQGTRCPNVPGNQMSRGPVVRDELTLCHCRNRLSRGQNLSKCTFLSILVRVTQTDFFTFTLGRPVGKLLNESHFYLGGKTFLIEEKLIESDKMTKRFWEPSLCPPLKEFKSNKAVLQDSFIDKMVWYLCYIKTILKGAVHIKEEVLLKTVWL